MNRLPRSLATLALLLAVSLPAILFVVAACIGAAHVQQVVTTNTYPRRQRR